jgi:pimeloyl-ACP methyl ester carboxylesterase
VTAYKTETVDGLEVFYREAGDPANPTLVLLHGYPSSSFMFRNLIPALEDGFHLVAPDYPGFGNTESPAPSEFEYTFDQLSRIVEALLESLGLTRFGIYIQDYGAPVGQRIAVRRPEWIEALIVQNGNAYEEGFSKAWSPIRHGLWVDRSAETEALLLEGFISPDGIKAQWTAGARNPAGLSPDGWNMDRYFMAQPHKERIQFDLLYDYRTNVTLYPEFHRFLRERRPPTLIAWGERDPFFTVEGARAYLRDVPDAELHLLPTGHFALEEELDTIADLIRLFYIGKVVSATKSAGTGRDAS